MSRHKLSRDERKAIWNAMNRRCAYCGERIELEDMCIDHVRPLALGGRDTSDNMVCACWHCNQHKANKTVEEFRSELQRGPVMLFRESCTYRTMLRYNQVNETRRRIVFYFEKKDRERHVSKKQRKRRHRPYF